MPTILPFYHLAQTLIAGYTGMLSYSSIRKVQTYEEMTQKAAKYSNVADHHLQTTRTTQGAGAVSVLTSILTSLYLLSTSVTTSTSSSSAPIMSTLLSIALAIGITAAHTHISNYWRGKAKVPLPKAGDYNDAITTSNQMRQLLGGLAVSWGVVAVWYFVGWVS